MIIKPNFTKSILITFCGLILTTILIMVISEYFSGNWSSPLYYVSLLIPISIMTIGVTFSFTPQQIKITEHNISIKYLLRREKIIALSTIKAYGEGNGVYVLYLKDKINPIQFSTTGFLKNDWKQFEALLSKWSDAPVADGYIGPFPLTKKKQEK